MNRCKEADRVGQQKVINELIKLFSGATLNIQQHWVDGATIDIAITATTKNNEYYYIIEGKDRNYNHDSFNGEWFLEKDKYESMMEYRRNNKVLYINTFKDNYMVVWDITKINLDNIKKGTKNLPKCTMYPSEKKEKTVYYLPLTDAIYCQPFIQQLES